MSLGAFRLNTLSKMAKPKVAIRTAIPMTAQGNAQISTSASKFGGSSIALDGTGDYVKIDATYNSTFSFTGDFTIEGWVNGSSFGQYAAIATNWESGWYFAVWNGNSLYFYANGAQRVAATGLTFTTGTWYHVAVTRSGSTIRVFKDGTQVGSNGTLSGTVSATDFTGIGANVNNNDVTNYWNGYIDEFRISKVARYTANFTAPTAAFVDDLDTLLLVHADGSNGSTSFVDDNY